MAAARRFNVFANFTAINGLSTPLRTMARSFATLNTATRQLQAPISSVTHALEHINHINFNSIESRLARLGTNISRSVTALNRMGNSAFGSGAAALGVGYVGNKLLQPEIEAQKSVLLSGMRQTMGKTVSLEDTIKLGKKQADLDALNAISLPVSSTMLTKFGSLLSQHKVLPSADSKNAQAEQKKIYESFTNFLPAMGLSELDPEFMLGLQAMLRGDLSDIFQNVIGKSGVDRASHKVKIKLNDIPGVDFNKLYGTAKDGPNKNVLTFNTIADELNFMKEFGKRFYPHGTEGAMKSTGGKITELVETVMNGIKVLWEHEDKNGLSAIKVVNSWLDSMTNLITIVDDKTNQLLPKAKRWIEPFVELAGKHSELLVSLPAAIPAFMALGAALKIVAWTASGLRLAFMPFGRIVALVALFWSQMDGADRSSTLDAVKETVLNMITVFKIAKLYIGVVARDLITMFKTANRATGGAVAQLAKWAAGFATALYIIHKLVVGARMLSWFLGGWIRVTIAAGLATYELYKHWDLVKSSVEAVWDRFKAMMGGIDFTPTVTAFKDGFSKLFDWLGQGLAKALDVSRLIPDFMRPADSAFTATTSQTDDIKFVKDGVLQPMPTNGVASNGKSLLDALLQRESSGDYTKTNAKTGYIGGWQMGEAALQDIGMYKGDNSAHNDWKGGWTGKYGVNSLSNFLSNPIAQRQAITEYHQTQLKQMNRMKIPGGDAERIAAAHLTGVGGARDLFKYGINRADGNGTTASDYASSMRKYDTSYLNKPSSANNPVHVNVVNHGNMPIQSKVSTQQGNTRTINVGANRRTMAPATATGVN